MVHKRPTTRHYGALPVVFLCVDNHKTRYEISKYLEQAYNSVLIINGGNNKNSGHVTVYEKVDGEELDPAIYKLYPEINPNADLRPDEVDCGSVQLENDQTAITNNMVATVMLAMFSQWYRTGGFEQKTRAKDKNGNNITVRKNEVIMNFETFNMTALAHAKDVDNRPVSPTTEEIPEGAEVI